MKFTKREFWSHVNRQLRIQFLAGILVTVPIGATALILVWMFVKIDNILQPIIRPVVGRSIPGLGFAITIVLIYLVGVIASNVGGKRLIQFGESLLAKVPVVRPIYASIKQILTSFSEPGKNGFMETVLIEFPRKKMWTLGFITKETIDQSGKNQLNIFIPTSPNPTSGFLQITREDEIIRTNISVNEALRMIISAGKVSPEEISNRLSDIDMGT